MQPSKRCIFASDAISLPWPWSMSLGLALKLKLRLFLFEKYRYKNLRCKGTTITLGRKNLCHSIIRALTHEHCTVQSTCSTPDRQMYSAEFDVEDFTLDRESVRHLPQQSTVFNRLKESFVALQRRCQCSEYYIAKWTAKRRHPATTYDANARPQKQQQGAINWCRFTA